MVEYMTTLDEPGLMALCAEYMPSNQATNISMKIKTQLLLQKLATAAAIPVSDDFSLDGVFGPTTVDVMRALFAAHGETPPSADGHRYGDIKKVHTLYKKVFGTELTSQYMTYEEINDPSIKLADKARKSMSRGTRFVQFSKFLVDNDFENQKSGEFLRTIVDDLNARRGSHAEQKVTDEMVQNYRTIMQTLHTLTTSRDIKLAVLTTVLSET